MKKIFLLTFLLLFTSMCFAESAGNIVVEKTKTVISKSEINRENLSEIVKKFMESGTYLSLHSDSYDYYCDKSFGSITVSNDNVAVYSYGKIQYDSIIEIRLDKNCNLVIKYSNDKQ